MNAQISHLGLKKLRFLFLLMMSCCALAVEVRISLDGWLDRLSRFILLQLHFCIN